MVGTYPAAIDIPSHRIFFRGDVYSLDVTDSAELDMLIRAFAFKRSRMI